LLAPEGQTEAQFMSKARLDFLEKGSATCLALQSLFQGFHKARNDAERGVRLESLYRKVHFLTVSARVAECPCLTQMASVLEALLFEIIANPTKMSPSIFRTVALAIDFLGALYERDQEAPSGPPASAHILVLDDDQISNRLIVSALRSANFEAESVDDPIAALGWLRQKAYDLILVDLEMPGIDGFEFCRRARQLPGCQHTPVIYVTIHSAFENRVKSALSGGQDLIAKPVFPMELAVKVVTQIMKSQILAAPGVSTKAGSGV
jgi:CheY-like chemotaxis protein